MRRRKWVEKSTRDKYLSVSKQTVFEVETPTEVNETTKTLFQVAALFRIWKGNICPIMEQADKDSLNPVMAGPIPGDE